jgi:hypothetical protein
LIKLPDSFTNLAQAASCLDSIMVQGYIHQDPVVCTPDYELIAEHHAKTQALLKSWYDALSNLLSQHQQDKNHLLRESVPLKIKYHIAYITMSPLQQHQGELRFDNHLRNFEAIISLSTEWLTLTTVLAAPPEPVRCNIAGGEHSATIIPGLMLSTLHCRCPRLRRQAVAVLTHPDYRKRGT